MCRLIGEYIDRNRLVYNPARGLVRECKFPMKPDTQLRKYINKKAVQADTETIVTSMPAEEKKVRSSKSGPKVSKGRACKSARNRKATVLVEKHVDIDASSDSDVEVVAPERIHRALSK